MNAQPQANANADNSAVARNALTGYAAWTVNLGAGLVLTPVLLRSLGTDRFGAWTLALAISGYVGMVDLGLGVAAARHIATALALGDTSRTSGIAASARAAYLVVAGIGMVALALFVGLAPIVTTGEVRTASVRVAVFLVGSGMLFALALNVYPAIAVGAGRTDLGVTVAIIARVTTTLAQVLIVVLTSNVPALAAVTAGGALLSALAVRFIARRQFGTVDTSLANASRADVRLLVTSGWKNAAIGAAAAVALQSDVVIVGAILSATAVAAYGIAVRAAKAVQDLATRGTDVLIPTFAHTTAVGHKSRTVSALHESVFLSRVVLAPALIGAVAFGQPLLRLWLGRVPSGASTVLTLLVLGTIVAAPGHTCFVLLTGMNRLNYLLIGFSITAVANLALSIVLTMRVGITGPILGSLAGFVVWDAIVLPRHVGRLLGISWIRLVFSGCDRLAAPSLLSAACAWALVSGVGWRSPTQGLLGGLVVTCVYGVAAGPMLGRQRRERYGRAISGALRLRRAASS